MPKGVFVQAVFPEINAALTPARKESSLTYWAGSRRRRVNLWSRFCSKPDTRKGRRVGADCSLTFIRRFLKKSFVSIFK